MHILERKRSPVFAESVSPASFGLLLYVSKYMKVAPR